jgi:hypothetical protein
MRRSPLRWKRRRLVGVASCDNARDCASASRCAEADGRGGPWSVLARPARRWGPAERRKRSQTQPVGGLALWRPTERLFDCLRPRECLTVHPTGLVGESAHQAGTCERPGEATPRVCVRVGIGGVSTVDTGRRRQTGRSAAPDHKSRSRRVGKTRFLNCPNGRSVRTGCCDTLLEIEPFGQADASSRRTVSSVWDVSRPRWRSSPRLGLKVWSSG